ncbi:major capsid protein [Alterisphingorhabdus coralli]|uniref:Major capsid protein n=1 Tax=Alterisphingorhabdus coralli TaxID=3071408 RepID=A0AA97F8X6_9SPHN|nr:major capsid protein [Parasphingorhabdus sp. SCSIO 66989]WOE76316.1 major capsid protein [Parasphingorhabdus sp. SCSIO 66989]
MTITPQFYDTAALLGVMREEDAPSFFWASYFTNQTNQDDEYIDFEKIPHSGRRLATFVTPMSQGKPIYERRSVLTRIKPSYIKMKDAVTPDRVMKRRPGELLDPNPSSPEMRRQAIIADIAVQHNEAIDRRLEWLAARAMIDGRVVIEDDLSPSREVDFRRDAAHTVALTTGARWDQTTATITENIETWRTLCRRAEFGGRTNRVIFGTDAWDAVRKNDDIKALMDRNFRGRDGNVRTGLSRDSEIEFVGDLGPDLEAWVYSDYYEEGSTRVDFLDPKAVVLTGPNLNGYRCFGAIQDPHARYGAWDRFPRNYLEQGDPAAEYVLTQSAPIMVPMNPNVTFKATVLT